jgi:hypothetical protein
VRHAINELYKLLPPDLASTEQAKQLHEHDEPKHFDVLSVSLVALAPAETSFAEWRNSARSRHE